MTCSTSQVALDAYLEMLQVPPPSIREVATTSRLQRRLRYRHMIVAPTSSPRPVAAGPQRVRLTGA